MGVPGGWSDRSTFEDHDMGKMTPQTMHRERAKSDYTAGGPMTARCCSVRRIRRPARFTVWSEFITRPLLWRRVPHTQNATNGMR